MIDKRDLEIIHALAKNAMLSHEQLAKQTNMSPSTVRRRLNRLTKDNILRFSALANPLKCGLPLLVAISMDIAHEHLHKVARTLTKNHCIKWAATTTGKYDLLLMGAFESPDKFSEFMEKEISPIKGLRSLESSVCLNILKGRFMSI